MVRWYVRLHRTVRHFDLPEPGDVCTARLVAQRLLAGGDGAVGAVRNLVRNLLAGAQLESETSGGVRRVACGRPAQMLVFPHHPGRHASLILNDGGLERINHSSAQIVCGLTQQSLVDQVPFRAIR